MSKAKFHILLRHCMESTVSQHKQRPVGFDRSLLFQRLCQTVINENVIVFLDKNSSVPQPHFTEKGPFPILQNNCGSEASAFLHLLKYIKDQALSKQWSREDIIVILEDDYAVQSGWKDLIREGLQYGDYVTLYDHPDKYSELYKGVSSLLFQGKLRHWRTTPSTTNSYAMKVGTLLDDFLLHRFFSERVSVTRDHEKFLSLWQTGKTLVSCIPGAWSHEEIGMQCNLSPEPSLSQHIPKQVNQPEMTYFS
jgi:hypothetical protein